MSADGKTWHGCAAPNCGKRCQTKYLACWTHWCCIPKALKARVYATCRAGMGADYRAAVAECVEIWIRRDASRAGLLI